MSKPSRAWIATPLARPSPGGILEREPNGAFPPVATAPPLRRAVRRVAADLCRADEPPMARSRGGSAARRPANLRPLLLPVPGQCESQRRAESEVRLHLRIHERLRRPAAGFAGGIVQGRCPGGRKRTGH